MTNKRPAFTSLMIFSILLTGLAGCAPAGTPSPVPATAVPVLPTPTLASGWETDDNDAEGQCGFAIDHPADMDSASQGAHSWTLRTAAEDPGGPIPNFIYISVIPDGFQSTEPGEIYNYDPGETQTLLNMQIGESKSLREDPNLAPSFTYTRLPDVTLGGQAAQAYENTQPWEFPPSTKEIRYSLKGSGCTFLLGGYLSTVGTGQPGAIDQELFEQIVHSFRLK
jgi:hypothetical protein